MNHSDHVHIAYYFVISLLTTSLIVLSLVLLVIVFCKKKQTTDDQSEEIVLPAKICARVYPLTDIDAATDGFNSRRIIGEGRLGTVYAAIFDKGEIAAVKRIHPRLVLGNIGFGFSRTLGSLSLAQHPNVVPIVGYSEAPGERIIVMEFVGMVCLDFYLHQNPDGASLLDWNHRLKTAAGAARGLKYLHEGVSPNIVHGCVKPSNILVDVQFTARVCDYGLSFLAPKEKKGLVGYVDDEYWRGGGGVCKESDVFGFGVVLLELLSGRGCEEGLLVKWALPLIKETRFSELLDPRLVIPHDITPLVRLAKVASTCVSNSRKSRPSISQVATILNNLEMDTTLTSFHQFGKHSVVFAELFNLGIKRCFCFFVCVSQISNCLYFKYRNPHLDHFQGTTYSRLPACGSFRFKCLTVINKLIQFGFNHVSVLTVFVIYLNALYNYNYKVVMSKDFCDEFSYL